MFHFADHQSGDEEIYFYHGDHLGSASWITDKSAKPIQYIHYLPYGEILANQRASGYDERFKFTTKELDAESGYYYFGARYLMSELGYFLSTDPLTDKTPEISSYLYCNGNPLKYIDPTGKEIEGVSISDAMRFRADIKRILNDTKFSSFTKLLKLSKNKFRYISQDALEKSFNGISLSEDEAHYIKMLTNTINDKNHTYKIEYFSMDINISEYGKAILAQHNPNYATLPDNVIGVIVGNPDSGYGGGITMPTDLGSYSLIVPTMKTRLENAIVSNHELLGHGLPCSFGITGSPNNSNAIQTENMIRRILQMGQNNGKNHAGPIISPYILPSIY